MSTQEDRGVGVEQRGRGGSPVGRPVGHLLADLPRSLAAPLHRHHHLRWRADQDEVDAALPGDVLYPQAQFRATRAVTIAAPPARVWPWLEQGRGAPTDRNAFQVAASEEPQWLLWTRPGGSWVWYLTPLPGGGTRLVTRVCVVYDWSRPREAALDVVLTEFGDFPRQRRMLLGIKERAEALAAARPA